MKKENMGHCCTPTENQRYFTRSSIRLAVWSSCLSHNSPLSLNYLLIFCSKGGNLCQPPLVPLLLSTHIPSILGTTLPKTTHKLSIFRLTGLKTKKMIPKEVDSMYLLLVCLFCMVDGQRTISFWAMLKLKSWKIARRWKNRNPHVFLLLFLSPNIWISRERMKEFTWKPNLPFVAPSMREYPPSQWQYKHSRWPYSGK